MGRVYEGNLLGEGLKLAVLVSRFNEFIGARLLEGAMDALLRHGVQEADITVVRVPGAFEVPLVAKKAAQSRKYAAVICLGAVIRGSTPHFDYVASEVSKGIANTALETGVPIVFGIITADNIEQAIERAGTKAGNKGFDAALTAIEMANLLAAMGEEAGGKP